MSDWMLWVYLFMTVCTAFASYERGKDRGAVGFFANTIVGLTWPLVITSAIIQRILRG